MTGKDTGMYIEMGQLGKFARNIAGTMGQHGSVTGVKAAEQAAKNLRRIKAVTERLTQYTAKMARLPGEVEWLLDNWYLAEREGRDAIHRIKTCGKLPAAPSRPKKSVVSEAAAALVCSGRGEITRERMELFLDEFQNERVLNEKELYIFNQFLKAELINFLAETCGKINVSAQTGESSSELSGLMENVFTSLRTLRSLDVSELTTQINRTDRILRKDPAGIYHKMDDETRAYYRREVARLAEKEGAEVSRTAEKVVSLCENSDEKHVGHYIFEKPLGGRKKVSGGEGYIYSIVLSTLFFTLLAGFLMKNAIISLLLIIPISEIVKNIADYAAIKLKRPRRTPRLELKNGIPGDGRTLCVMSMLVTSKKEISRCAGLMEEYRLANRDSGKNLIFGLLADMKSASTETLEDDEELKEHARREIEGLNSKYGGGFTLFLRGRTYSRPNGCYMGWERKRGAVLELTRLLRGQETGLGLFAGNDKDIKNIRYIIALDSDTRLTAGSAKELVGAALHPLNTPVIDRAKGIVVRGSGIIQPRISVSLDAANKSDFTMIFAGQGGIDPYGSVTSDVYQDLFGEGSFNGKGIIDVEAFHACMDEKFPENTILSHDLLEGAYLGCSYMGDVELTDGYPCKVTSYYSRMHRWVRGDWQTLPWLKKKVRDAGGVKRKNHISPISKWKILDNLRRSLVPIFTFAAVFAGMFVSRTNFAWTAVIAVLSVMSGAVLSAAELVLRHDAGIRRRYHSTIIPGFAGGFMQIIIRLMLLPYEAWICLGAVCTALWRMLVTKRNMLAWITSADAEVKMNNKVLENYIRMWPCVVLGFLTLFSPYAPAFAMGIIWLFTPLYAYGLGREIVYRRDIPALDKMYLMSCAGDIWKYFRDFLSPNDNYLPPDNWQEQPASGVAHRTSPTNIGLALLSILAALDMGLTTQETAVSLLECMLESIERLPKWKGHLYNWYDTRTIKVLEPGYVSAVDSGNMAGSLIALREGLLEIGEQELAVRADKILKPMNFAPLFDGKKKLFYIGWDLGKNEPTEGWYDLMASEARQTSYIAIARGEVPKKHWGRLGRTLVSQDGYSGMASWTGTMFEYLMPNLLLPCYRNSMIFESSKFCVYAQKKRCEGAPWGISESAFYAFDPALNYRYKAHGVQRLAMKRKMDSELVVSPYSSFLALEVDPKGAIRNLKNMERLGAAGKYGFYEALDFTPARQTGKEFELVRTYMAHHLGMSILSIDNLLNGEIMRKRFMRDREMAAFAELLQEKVPVGEVVLRDPPQEIPDKPVRAETAGWSAVYEGVDAVSPKCVLVSNEVYSVLLTESGMSRSVWNGLEMTRFENYQFSHNNGMSFWLRSDRGVMPLLPTPDYDRDVSYISEFSGATGKIKAVKNELSSTVSVSVPQDEAGELRTVEIKYDGSEAGQYELLCYFEPVLQQRIDYESHPAFSRLSLEMSQENGALVVERRGRGKGHSLYMCFSCDKKASYVTSKQQAFGRSAPGGFAADTENVKFMSAAPEACVLASVKLNLRPGESETVKFALAPAQTGWEAREAALRILETQDDRGESRLDGLAKRYKLKQADINAAMDMLTNITFTTGSRRENEELIRRNPEGQRGLWRFGISGDLPLVSAKVTDEDALEGALSLISKHALISGSGASFDLALLLSDGSDYRTPMRTAVIEHLRAIGRERALGGKGGVHITDLSEEGADVIPAMSAEIIDLSEKSRERARNTGVYPAKRPLPKRKSRMPEWQRPENGVFEFNTANGLPENAWGSILTNGEFGFAATDAGTGFMWHMNARENRINRWLNDSLTAEGTERLIFRQGNEISLFAASDGLSCNVSYGMGYARWDKHIGAVKSSVTAFVPRETNARVLIIEMEGDLSGGEVLYSTDLLLGPDEKSAHQVVTAYENGIFRGESVSKPGDDPFYVASSAEAKEFTGSRIKWDCRDFDNETGAGVLPCAALSYKAASRMVIVTGCDSIEKLTALTDYGTACSSLARTAEYWRSVSMPVTVSTPDRALDDYLNGWAMYQTFACRIKGRTSIYQSGGAYGFRDQLQDACAMLINLPEETAKQLMRSAARQYEEGDVQHWWHEGLNGESAKGVRTRCSDDLLWLPYVLCEYVKKTGDRHICAAEAPYLHSPPLTDGEDERYETAAQSIISEALIDHAVRAARLVILRGTGTHGLCLVGTGDWNDGMNMVGEKGRGESVWLTWFASLTLRRLSELCRDLGREDIAEELAAHGEAFRTAADSAWDGGWYLRGYYDSGAPLGSAASDECAIDSIAQSFAAFAGGNRERTDAALKKAVERLLDREHKIVKLFEPPFDRGIQNPGYIKGYCPGFRENGGQYTHAAIWLAAALFRRDMADTGHELLNAILPQTHDGAAYKKEPYVLAGDVSANPDNMGLGGWPWYTGAAAWYYRIATEELLGLHVRGGKLFVEPNLPSGWQGYSAVWHSGGEEYAICVSRAGEYIITVNGKSYDKSGYDLKINNNFIARQKTL